MEKIILVLLVIDSIFMIINTKNIVEIFKMQGAVNDAIAENIALMIDDIEQLKKKLKSNEKL